MNLVTHLPLLEAVKDVPPIKLINSGLAVPEDVDLTFIGIEHHDEAGDPDYLKEVLVNNDVYVPEFVGWDLALKRRLNRIAKGDYKSFEKAREQHHGQENVTPGQANYKTAADKAWTRTVEFFNTHLRK